MAREDFLKRQMEGLIRVYAKLLFNKEYKGEEWEELVPTTPQGEPISLQDDLDRMLSLGEIGQAEDLLFEVLEEAVEEKVSRRECEELVTWFYEQLTRMSDEELHRGDFSREENHRRTGAGTLPVYPDGVLIVRFYIAASPF